MYYIYSLLMIVLFAGGFFGLSTKFEGDPQITLLIVAWILTTTAIIWVFATMWGTMDKHNDALHAISRIKKERKDLAQMENSFALLKGDIIKYLSEQYPTFEREIFSKLSPTEAKDLTIYLAKYPELQTNTMLTLLVNQLSNWSKKILEKQENINYGIADLYRLKYSKWTLGTISVPVDIDIES